MIDMQIGFGMINVWIHKAAGNTAGGKLVTPNRMLIF